MRGPGPEEELGKALQSDVSKIQDTNILVGNRT